MRDIRIQYFLSYGLIGAVMPYGSVLFRQAGLGDAQIGYAYAIWSVAFILTPGLLTMLADLRADPRRLMALALGCSAMSLVALCLVSGVGPVLAAWTVYCLVSLPVTPLQDGICFSLQSRLEERGEPAMPFHRIRIWGTIGFMVPSVLVFFGFLAGMSVRGAVMAGAAFAVLAAVQSMRLEDPRPRDSDGARGAKPAGDKSPDASPGATPAKRFPTALAARALLQRPLLVLCVSIFLGQMTQAMYAAFYPLYSTEAAGVPEKWLGLISNIGVGIELLVIASTAWLTRALGLKRLLVLGLLAAAVRMGLLAAFANPAVAIGTQVFHGITILAMYVLPQTFLNGRARDEFRHSIQGLLVVLMGLGRVAGSLLGGALAGRSVHAVFACCAALSAAGALVILLLFDEQDEPARSAADEPAGGAPLAATAAEPSGAA
jgi:PPP family 3-phenylpropionic acid transporter